MPITRTAARIMLFAACFALGCASFRDSRFVPPFDFTPPARDAGALLIINRFAGPDTTAGSIVSEADRESFVATVEGACRDARLFSRTVTQRRAGRERDAGYAVILETELAISENLHPKSARVLNTFLFTWLDRRRVTLRASVYDGGGTRRGEYEMSERFETIGFLLLPVFPLLGRSERTVKDEVFRTLVVRVINAAQRDGAFAAPKPKE